MTIELQTIQFECKFVNNIGFVNNVYDCVCVHTCADTYSIFLSLSSPSLFFILSLHNMLSMSKLITLFIGNNSITFILNFSKNNN